MGLLPAIFKRALASVTGGSSSSALADVAAKTVGTTNGKKINKSKGASNTPSGNEKLLIQKKLLSRTEEAISRGLPHFKVGGKKLYFSKARVILLRPNAKHTPYQAKFIVPKSFNKLDLRDYLYHIYGLRVLNVTTQLLHGKHARLGATLTRFREPQIKKMTVDMVDPFIWPEEPESKDEWNVDFTKNMEEFRADALRFGSDRFKPSKAFDGVLGPYPAVPQPFVPKLLRKQMENKTKRTEQKLETLAKYKKIDQFLTKH